MFYELSQLFADLPGARLFAYISFRAAGAVFFAFLFAWILGGWVIPWLQRGGIGENVDSDSETLTDLHEGKRDTPTMGGIFVIGAILVSCLLWMRFDGTNRFSLLGVALVGYFGLVGLLDDWIKLRVEGKNGLSKRGKQLALTGGAVVVALLLVHVLGLQEDEGGPQLYFPFLKDISVGLAGLGGLPFVLVAIIVLTGAANAVNLTDGLDGLAIGCVGIASAAYAAITYFVGHAELSDYLLVEHVAGCGEMTVLLGAVLGASLAFLWYNAPPAQVFMGDVGSLALGGALGYVALISRTELVLFVVGGVFVAEAVSVMVQVLSFRTTGRRVFRCAPLHHHFQFQGMPETRVVTRIWIVSVLLALSSLALFKVR